MDLTTKCIIAVTLLIAINSFYLLIIYYGVDLKIISEELKVPKRNEEAVIVTKIHGILDRKGSHYHAAEGLEEASMWCPDTLLGAGAGTTPLSHVWKNLHSRILSATYPILPTIDQLNSTMTSQYEKWVNQLFSFYTASRLRRSIMHPAPPREVALIMKLVHEIKKHNTDITDEEDRRSLRVLVVGGSVASGIGCLWPKNLGMPDRQWMSPDRCSWSLFLEKILNLALFDEDNIVRVDNAATGGVTSEFGSLVFDYQLYSEPDKIPDIIISAYAPNEATEPDAEKAYHDMQGFVKSVRNLNPCNDYAPLLIMLDDFYGFPYRAMEQTGSIYKVANWYNLMAVDYASTVKFKVYSNDEDLSHIPIFHRPYDFHEGIGMHIGIAWTLMFNIVNAMVNICNDAMIGTENHFIKLMDRNDNLTSSAAKEEERNIIDPALTLYLKKDEPPFQQVGSIGLRGGAFKNEVIALRNEVESNRKANEELCEKNKDKETLTSKKKCAWSWFYNHLQPFDLPRHVDMEMNKVLLFNEGWKAEGHRIRQPRTGWYAHTPNATFSMKVENLTGDVNHVVVLSMKSYSRSWFNSSLSLSTTAFRSPSIPETELNRTSSISKDINWNGESTYHIDGYHKLKTSVHFVHKFLIPDGGARAGESLILDAKLVGGKEFKIAGMALCSRV